MTKNACNYFFEKAIEMSQAMDYVKRKRMHFHTKLITMIGPMPFSKAFMRFSMNSSWSLFRINSQESETKKTRKVAFDGK